MRDRHVFIWQSVEILNVFNTSSITLKKIFRKMKIFSRKLGYHFIVESIKIGNAWFPWKTAISEANVEANGMVSTKWTYYKEQSFAGNYFIFSKKNFQSFFLLQRVVLVYQRLKCPYSYFLQALQFYLTVIFPCEYH